LSHFPAPFDKLAYPTVHLYIVISEWSMEALVKLNPLMATGAKEGSLARHNIGGRKPND